MPPPRDPTEGYTLDEPVIAQMYEHEALLKLLIEKGVITKDEYLEKVKMRFGSQGLREGRGFGKTNGRMRMDNESDKRLCLRRWLTWDSHNKW